MKRVFVILFGLLVFLTLTVIGTVLIMPEDGLTKVLRPLPLIGARTEEIIDYKNDTNKKLSYLAEDTIYSVKSKWRSVTDFSLTNHKQKVVIELTPVRHKEPRIQQEPPTTPTASPPVPLTKTEEPHPPVIPEPEAPPAEVTSETTPEVTPEATPETPETPETTEATEVTQKPIEAEPQKHMDTPAPETPNAGQTMAPEPATEASPLPSAPKAVPIKKVEKEQIATIEPVKKIPPTPIKRPPPAPKTNIGANEHKMGLAYYKGIDGVAQDYTTALDWFLKSSAKGNAASQYNLGIMAYLGQGMEQSYEQAAKWFEQAAKQDHALAQYNLGFLFYEGKGVPKDDLQAFMWIDRAARLGDKKAIKARDTLEEILPKDILETK